MAVSKEQVKQLLGTGLSNEIVASTVGCDPSYISQLLADPQFHDEVVALRAAALTANNERDRNIDSIEDRLIEKLSDAIDQGQLYKPHDILRSFAVVNAAKRRGVQHQEAAVINNRIVNLNLPKVVVNQFTINSHGEVIEAGNQTLVTMPARQLLNKLVADKGVDRNAVKQIESYLPDSASAGREETPA